MISLTLHDIQLIMSIVTFFIGLITFGIGISILVTNTMGKDLRTMTAQTVKLAQKGLAEEVSGLVGNASTLLNALNGMVHTAQGIGLFLTVTGVIIILISFWLIFRIQS